ncbi:MAG: hypothetical protein ACP5SD_06620 [Elusimicrobiales bacterium]
MSFKPKMGGGDFGLTDFYAKRVRKDSLDVLALALIDEINALLSQVSLKKKKLLKLISKIQNYNMTAMGNVAGFVGEKELKDAIKNIEFEINRRKKTNIKNFVLFNKNEVSVLLNLIRAKIRIVEIIAWRIKKKSLAVYLNRLSDIFFLISIQSDK